jgi:hypothetical protein
MGGLTVQIHGAVSSETASAVAGHIAEAYETLAPPPRAPLEVRLVDSRERMAALGAADKARYGIATAGDEGFACAHDAFEDRPRITICVEAFERPGGSSVAALRHEVGHAALHGRRVFYEVRLDADLRRAAALQGLNEASLLQLLFFVSVGAKDWGVSRLLLRHGFLDDVRALAWEMLAFSEDDRMAWRLAKGVPALRILWAASQFKPLLHAAPLRALPEGREVEARAGEMLHYLPEGRRDRLVKLAWSTASDLGDDTHANITLAAGRLLEEGF